MEIETQGIAQSLRFSYQSRIESAVADLARRKKLSKCTHASLARTKFLSSSMGTPPSDEPHSSGITSDNARLLAGTGLQGGGSRWLQDRQRIVLETREQGSDILRSLRGRVDTNAPARADTTTGSRSVSRRRILSLVSFTDVSSSLLFHFVSSHAKSWEWHGKYGCFCLRVDHIEIGGCNRHTQACSAPMGSEAGRSRCLLHMCLYSAQISSLLSIEIQIQCQAITATK